MKVIFLDLDGVMITGSYQKRSTQFEGYRFTPSCVDNLKQMMEKTGAKIVVTSTYRMAGFEYLRKMFEANGLTEGLIGQTPVIEYSIRGEEIRQYIEESHFDPSNAVEQFVILDDHDDMGELLPYLVQTHWVSGLDEEAKEKAIDMLENGVSHPNSYFPGERKN